uniref:Biopterin-dependent aromatic amino acid hydroxylase family profile domain-containing protein n=1 Tax=Parascaris univalens TaxID=6257 RepID=A0A914ZGN5_PARUN
MIQFAVSDQSKVQRFEPEVVVKTEPLVTTYQTGYFYTRSLEEAIVKLRAYTTTLKRPFTVRYNAHTQSIDVMNSKESLKLAAESLRFSVEQINTTLAQIIF